MRIIYTLLIIISLSFVTLAQSNTVAAGGQSSGTGGSVSYSLGQIDYLNKTSSAGSTSEGNQQPYEIFLLTAITESELNLEVKVFPNPITDNLFLSIPASAIKNMSYSINDVDGKIIFSQELTDENTNINMCSISSGVYFIKVLDKNKLIRTFKIIKNK